MFMMRSNGILYWTRVMSVGSTDNVKPGELGHSQVGMGGDRRLGLRTWGYLNRYLITIIAISLPMLRLYVLFLPGTARVHHNERSLGAAFTGYTKSHDQVGLSPRQIEHDT